MFCPELATSKPTSSLRTSKQAGDVNLKRACLLACCQLCAGPCTGQFGVFLAIYRLHALRRCIEGWREKGRQFRTIQYALKVLLEQNIKS